MARTLRREPIAVSPVAVSERNCEAVIGIPPWRLRRIATEYGIGRTGGALGRQCLVPVADLLRALELDTQPRGLDVLEEAESAKTTAPIDECDRVLAVLCRRRRP